MKRYIISQEQLIISLASSGDPMAFYSLIVTRFQKKYLYLRSSGTSHEDATQTIISEAANVFEKFRGTIPVNFEEWLDNQCESVLPKDDDTEFSIEKGISTDCLKFNRELQLHLMRTVSKLSGKKKMTSLFSLIRRHTPSRAAIIFTTICIGLILGFYLYLAGSKSYLKIIFNNSRNEYSFAIPFNVNTSKDSLKSDQHNIAIHNDSITTTIEDTVKAVPPPPPPVPVKKVIVRPRKTEQEQAGIPGTTSSGFTEQTIIHEQKPLSETSSTTTESGTTRNDSQNE